jgi:flagellar hook-basal body complex protein FliE
MIGMINLRLQSIMRFYISFSIFDLFILQHDQHDHSPLSRAGACVRTRLRTCVRAHVECGYHHVDHAYLAYGVVRNLFTTCPYKSGKMSLCLFSRVRFKSLVALLTSYVAPMVNLNTRRHAKLWKSIAEYAADFGVSERTVKYWIRRGKDLGHKVPLDSPGKMAAWWHECFPNREVPDYLLVIKDAGAAAEGAEQIQASDFSDLKVLDIEQSVHELRRTLAKNQKLLDESFTTANQRNYRDCFDLLRKAELDLTEVQRVRGKLIDKEVVLAELAQQSETFATTRERMARDIMIEVEKHCPKRLVRIFGLIKNLLEPAVKKVREGEDEIFRQLQAFGDPAAVNERLDLILQRE